MVQCPDILKNLKKGDRVTIYRADTGDLIGQYVFDHFEDAMANKTIEMDNGAFAFLSEVVVLLAGSDNGTFEVVFVSEIVVLLAGCQHDWKRVDLFRTTEFCCTKCPAVRPFNIEKDEAA